MLDDTMKGQLATHFEKITAPVRLVASLDDTPASAEMLELLTELSELSEHLEVDRDGDDQRRPSFSVERLGTDVGVRFAGIPMGHEFTSLVLALLQVGGHAPNVADETVERIRAIDGQHHFETFVSLTCQNCPDVVQALNALSVINPSIRHTMVDGALFQDEVEARNVQAVPTVFLDGEVFSQGRMSLDDLLAKLDVGGADREVATIDAMDPVDVLVVGGGPAGAAAAIYSARKGVRTAVVAERFGGQVLDTMTIENFISVSATEGPKLVAALEQHVHEYDVDVLQRQQAVALEPADEEGGLATVRLASGAAIQARTVVVATGARWRNLGVPGEQEHRNKGVTYCPHCDGPLFKGKRVAVIGGGNSGVEAAIDLAGVVAHVTLVEFDDQLRADDVLQRKLTSLPNVDVMVSARTTEVVGDGTRVQALRYEDRTDGTEHLVELDGVFVQIGLLPTTEWLDGVVERTRVGEVVIDARGRTSVPGVFAAGDCTDVPFKQIVIAMGAGATASLSAFDHLIRTSAPADTADTSAPADTADPIREPARA